MNLTQRCASVDEQLVGLIARKVALTEQLAQKQARMTELADKKAFLTKCLTVLDTLIQTVAAKGVGRVEQAVSSGLQLVFGPDLSCVIERKDGARGTTYRIQIKNSTPDGDVIDDPMEAFGGGVVNVTAFLLRVLLLQRFKLQKLLVLDEAFNNVSVQYLPAVSGLLQSLADDYGFTILAVTHQPELARAAHHAYAVSAEGPVTLHKLQPGEI